MHFYHEAIIGSEIRVRTFPSEVLVQNVQKTFPRRMKEKENFVQKWKKKKIKAASSVDLDLALQPGLSLV